jgi:uncharacterized protein
MTVTPPWAGASLTGPGEIAVALLVVAYCVLAQPLVGYRLHRLMEREVAADSGRRWHGYARLLVLELVLGGLAVAVAAGLNGIGLQRIGLSGPHLTGSGLLFGVGLAIAILVCAAIVASTIAIWRLDRPIPVIGGDRVRIMVPVRRSERLWFLALSVAAGVCEELLFRGLLPALLSALLHGPPAWFVILLAAIAFGAAHAYQGTAGVAATAVLGALMGIIYLATGSLVVVMVLHALIDARVGLLPARAVGRAPGDTAPA